MKKSFKISAIVFFVAALFCFVPACLAGSEGQTPPPYTPDSTYYFTDPQGNQVLVDTELGKAALIFGGYVPVENPDPAIAPVLRKPMPGYRQKNAESDFARRAPPGGFAPRRLPVGRECGQPAATSV